MRAFSVAVLVCTVPVAAQQVTLDMSGVGFQSAPDRLQTAFSDHLIGGPAYDWQYSVAGEVGMGAIRLSASASGSHWIYQGGGPEPYAQATASFTDTITIHASNPLLVGTGGVLRVAASFDGSTHISSGAWPFPGFEDRVRYDSSYFMRIDGNGLFHEIFSPDNPLSSGLTRDTIDAGFLELDVPFVFGVSFDIGLSASVQLRATTGLSDGQAVPGGFNMNALFGNTFSWGGIESVVSDSSGPLARGEWQLDSLSHTDWSISLPAPGSFACMALAGLTLARRKRER